MVYEMGYVSLSPSAIELALGKLVYTVPILTVNSKSFVYAVRSAFGLPVAIVVDNNLEDNEWIIEFGGRRVHSEGC